MKKSWVLVVGILCLLGCKNEVVEQPNKTIDKKTMVNILYDLAVLEAARSQSYASQVNYPTAIEFVKEKYKIDSLTLAENTKYYAADMKEFKKMYDEVKERLTKNREAMGETVNNSGYTNNPNEGVVK